MGCAVIRHGAGIIKWTDNELRTLDRKTRQILTMYGAFHLKSDVDRLNLARAKGRRALISCEVTKLDWDDM